ncbi:MAG: peptidoglycan-binding protein [Candidatus Paceibacterota bacterium]|jgi:plastocyanin
MDIKYIQTNSGISNATMFRRLFAFLILTAIFLVLPSITNAAQLPAPTGLTNSAISCDATSVTISWNVVSGADHYWFRANDLTNSWIPTTGQACSAGINTGDYCIDNIYTNYQTISVTPGHSYDVWVHASEAVDNNGNASPLADIHFTVPTCVTQTQPPAPTGLSYGNISCNATSVNITWNSVSQATHYWFRANDLTNTWIPTAGQDCTAGINTGDYCKDNVTSTSQTIAVTPGHSYDVWVHSVSSLGYTELTDPNYSGLASPLVDTHFTVPTCAAQCAQVTITSPTVLSAVVGQYTSYTGSANANGTSVSVTYPFTTSLPPGMTVSGGVISGTPTVAGTYYVTMSATNYCESGGQTTDTKTLIITVLTNTSTISASCLASPSNSSVGQSVTWIPTVSGGTLPYSYSWTGTDGLYSTNQSPSIIYNTAGTKTATMVVTSADGQTLVRQCTSAYVNQPQQTITGSCSPSTSNITSGQSVTWNTNSISGGNGSYTYAWYDSTGYLGSGSSVYKSYYSSGTYNAYVQVTSGTQNTTIYCSPSVTVQQYNYQTLSASCAPSSSNISTGQTITWIPNVYGGNAPYTYSWSGSNGFYSSGTTPSQTYYSSGTYNASLIVTSADGQTRSVSCSSVYVTQNTPVYQNMTVSCSPSSSNISSGQTVTWIPSVYGGQAPYQYSWSGSDGFYSSLVSPSRTYYTSGTQTASVTVISSDGQYRTASCSPSVYVNQTYIYTYPALSVSCKPSQSSIIPGQTVTWTPTVTGGNGAYTYIWSGTSGLYGSTYSVSKTYPSIGTQTASLTVSSGDGQTRTVSCSPPVIVAEATIASCNYLNDYMRIDWNNNPTEVRKLQIFLRDLQGYSDTPVTGIFDQMTFNNVSKFQTKYVSDVLTPWGSNESTGFVYILTKKKVNEIYCKAAFPLTTQQQSEITAYRNFLIGLQSAGITTPTTTPSVQQNTQDLFRLSNEEVGLLMQNGGLTCRTDANGACIPGTLTTATTTQTASIASAFSSLGAAVIAGIPNMFGGLRHLFILLLVLLGIFLLTVGLIHRLPILATLENGGFLAPDVLVTFIWVTAVVLLSALVFGATFLAIPLLVILVLTVVVFWVKHAKKPRVVEDN